MHQSLPTYILLLQLLNLWFSLKIKTSIKASTFREKEGKYPKTKLGIRIFTVVSHTAT